MPLFQQAIKGSIDAATAERLGAGTCRVVQPQEMFGMAEELVGVTLDEGKVRTAVVAEKLRQTRAREAPADERKRKYSSMATGEVTPEQMEAYHRAKVRESDPMANFVDHEAVTDEEV
jgi:hypothetical protein